MNNNLVLVTGFTATGKSACLKDLANPQGVMYACTESGKQLPFKHNFAVDVVITDPMQVFELFAEAERRPDIDTVIVDSITYLMDMFESQYVLTAPDTRSAWGDYAQFFKKLMNEVVAKSTKNVIFTAHTANILNDTEKVMETLVKVKGALMNNGIESYFSSVISTKRMKLKDLDKYKNDNLTITEEEEILGFKYLFQTKLTKDTINERIRGPIGMWKNEETYIDNNIQHVLDRLHQYYN